MRKVFVFCLVLTSCVDREAALSEFCAQNPFACESEGGDAGSNDAGSNDAGANDAGSNDAGSNDAGSNDAGSDDAGSDDAGSNDAGSNDGGSNDGGSNDGGSNDAGFPVLVLSASLHDFGSVDAGLQVQAPAFTVTNQGTAPATDLAITSSAPVVFSTARLCGATLVPDAGCTFTVSFRPPTYGEFSAVVTASADGAVAATLDAEGVGIADVPIRVLFSGNGAGTVSTGAASCSSDVAGCSFSIPYLSSASFTATPHPTVSFDGFSGLCSGLGNPCTVQITDAGDLGVQFSRALPALLLTVDGGGTASISPTGTPCGPGCTAFDAGTVVTVTAVPFDPESTGVVGLNSTPGCAGLTCTFTMNVDRPLDLRFERLSYVFVSESLLGPGFLNSRAAADQACQAEAEAAGLPGQYLAWLGQDAGNASTRFGDAGAWMRPDQKMVAATFGSLLGEAADGRFVRPIVLKADGGRALPSPDGGYSIRTGVDQSGDDSPTGTCADWSSDAGVALTGELGATQRFWTFSVGRPCALPLRFYCFEVNRRVTPALPSAPPGAKRVFVTANTYNAGFGSAGFDRICTDEADDAGFRDAGFVFFGVTGLSPQNTALARLTSDGGWYRMDGILAIQSPASLSGATPILESPINVGPKRTIPTSSPRVWTGAVTPSSTAQSPSSCESGAGVFTASAGSFNSHAGFLYGSDGRFFSDASLINCTTTARLYCIQP